MWRAPLLRIALAAITLMSLCCLASAEDPADAGRGVVYTSWTPTTCYFAVKVDDPLIVGNQTLPLGRPWHDDAIAVYLDLNPTDAPRVTSDCVRVVISAAGGATVQRGDRGEWRDDPGWFQVSPYGTIRYGVDIQGTLNDSENYDRGYTVEVGLNWSLLKVRPPFSQKASDPLPAIGFAVAIYSQGETRAVSCWPEAMTEADLDVPARWGQLCFLQGMHPEVSTSTTAFATLEPGGPMVDGKMKGPEWLTAGVFTMKKRWGETATPIAPGRQSVSVLAAWYLLDPFAGSLAHQPLEPAGPWLAPEMSLYHLQQVREARKAGLDALAVALPVDPAQRTATRARLAALVNALQDYERATSAKFLFDTPLLLPVVDLSTAGDLDLQSEAGEQVVAMLLEDFYRLVPPQYRLMVPDAEQAQRYPIVLAAPAAGVSWDADCPARLDARLAPQLGYPIGWMLDTALKGGEATRVLTHCDWNPLAGLHVGNGPMEMAVLAPGVAASRTQYLPHRDGEIYENGWTQLYTTRPDFILIRSWNDFARGCEIAPSRQYGYLFQDTTKLATLRLAGERGFGVRILRHNLPAVLQPNTTYPVELLVKNGSVEKLVSSQGYRVDYRVTQRGRKVLSGIATDQIVLLEHATSRIRFTLTTGQNRLQSLQPGAYQLHLDFRRNKIPSFDLPMMTETLGTITLPFAIGEQTGPEVVTDAATLPATVATGAPVAAGVQVRNMGKRAWGKGKLQLHLRWTRDDGTVVSGGKVAAYNAAVPTGGTAAITGQLPQAPAQPGWYRASLDLVGVGTEPIQVATSLVQVVATDVRAQFLSIGLPREIAGTEPIEVPIALRNAGITPWGKANTRITYQWLSWDGQALPGATGNAPLTEDVKAGGATTLRIKVTPPAGSGAFRCIFTLLYQDTPAQVMVHPMEATSPLCLALLRPASMQPVDLNAAFNDYAATSDAVLVRGDFDGKGNAYPLEEFLPDMTNPPLGYKAGYYQQAPDQSAPSFRFGLWQRGRAPMVRAKGQTIALPGQKAAVLHLVAASSGRETAVPIVVKYTDGSEQQAEIQVSNWLDAPAFGEPVVLKTRYIRTAKGDDWYLHGSLFAYRITLDPARTAQSITLPTLPSVGIFAVTLEQ